MLKCKECTLKKTYGSSFVNSHSYGILIVMATKTITTRGTMALTGSSTVDTITLSTTRKTNVVITAITNTGTVYITTGDSTVSSPTAGTSDEFVVVPLVGFKVTIPLENTTTTLKLLASAATTVHIQVN